MKPSSSSPKPDLNFVEFTAPARQRRAFTLVEILVVVAIIGILAALIAGLAGRASRSKILKRAQAECQALVMAIEAYKAKMGYYPPDNPRDTSFINTALYYELTGTGIPDAVTNTFGVVGIANIGQRADNQNASPEKFVTGLRPDQFAEDATGARRLSFAYGNIPWRYNVSHNPTNNPGTFDLWVDIKIGNEEHIVGNWKD